MGRPSCPGGDPGSSLSLGRDAEPWELCQGSWRYAVRGWRRQPYASKPKQPVASRSQVPGSARARQLPALGAQAGGACLRPTRYITPEVPAFPSPASRKEDRFIFLPLLPNVCTVCPDSSHVTACTVEVECIWIGWSCCRIFHDRRVHEHDAHHNQQGVQSTVDTSASACIGKRSAMAVAGNGTGLSVYCRRSLLA